MSRLATLIRLNRWQLDERRRRVAELETLRENTKARISALDQAVAAEASEAERDLAIRASFPTYAAASKAQRSKLTATLDTLSTELAEAAEAVTIAFQELKRYELAEDARRRRDLESRAHRERLMLDEMALEGFRRESTGG